MVTEESYDLCLTNSSRLLQFGGGSVTDVTTQIDETIDQNIGQTVGETTTVPDEVP